uniref:Secreted protein n=1 Tax=Steinernema glaseri TaxID=37863 RepID=A0A1I7Z0G7_9BILA
MATDRGLVLIALNWLAYGPVALANSMATDRDSLAKVKHQTVRSSSSSTYRFVPSPSPFFFSRILQLGTEHPQPPSGFSDVGKKDSRIQKAHKKVKGETVQRR